MRSLTNRHFRRVFPIGDVKVVSYSGGQTCLELFLEVESFLKPTYILRYDFQYPKNEPIIFSEPTMNIKGFDLNNFSVEQIFYQSFDGTSIPMYIVQKKTENTGPKPCLLHGYGGFNFSLTPFFSEEFFYFVNYFDGILAIANIRGGGEYGTNWYDNGRLFKKHKSFDDFISGAEYLINKNYTNKKKLAIHGVSNGGFLVAACMNKRPDLFAAVVPVVGVMDMVRSHLNTVVTEYSQEYGNINVKSEYKNLIKFSPLHRIREPTDKGNQYPATLIVGCMDDDRVSVAHSLKFAAELQHAVQNNPYQTNKILLRVDEKGGHGKSFDLNVDILTFLKIVLRIETDT